MLEERITCPKCGTEIPLSEALTKKIEERSRKAYQEQLKEAEKELGERYKLSLAEAQAKALTKAHDEVSVQLADMQSELQEKTKRLQEGQKRELEILKKQRELDEQKRSLDLELERRLQEEKAQVEKATLERATEQHRLKDLEKDKQLSDLRKQIEELKRKAEQSSQQTQGAVAELDLEKALREAFPEDEVSPVPKGVRGADLVQRVLGPGGKRCGTIVWEVKNTKSWSASWLAKLRDDQRSLKADLAVIVSAVLPDDVTHFCLADGVWICDPATAIGLGSALRSQLLQVASARAASRGRGTKMELLYTYLTGTEFRQRVEAVVEAFHSLRDELDRERRAMETNWARREKHIARAVSGLAGMYGDMQGIVGPSLPKVRQLELAAPDNEEDD